MIGFGIVFPILPFYLEEFGGGGREMGIIVGIYAVTQFLFSPFWGGISEMYGRKPLLISGVLGVAFSHLLFAVAGSLWIAYIARALAGIVSAATLPIGMAYVSDTTTDEERGNAMGLLSGGMGVGVVLGPGLGGLLGSDSVTLPFYVAAILSFFAVALIVFLLPESLSKEEMIENGEKNNSINRKDMWAALFTPIGILLVVSFLMSFSLTNLETVFSLYSVERYGFNTKEVGVTLMCAGLVYAVVPAVLTGPLTSRFGDTAVLKVSLLASGVGFFLLLLPDTMVGVLLFGFIFVAGNALLRPTSVSLLSKRTTLGQGVTMGLTNSFNSLGRIVGPFWAGFFFDINIHMPYIGSGALLIVGFILSLLWLKPWDKYVVVED